MRCGSEIALKTFSMLELAFFLPALLISQLFADTGDDIRRKAVPYNQCPLELLKTKNQHRNVTGRSFKAIEKLMAQASKVSPAYDVDAVLAGEKSVLSLGEGRSSYIYELNEASWEASRLFPHHAVDVKFLSQDRFVGHRKGMDEFPGNYHAQSLDRLQLGEPGFLLKFDEITSSHLLNYLLHDLLMPGEYVNHAEAKNMMLRILAHSKPGGMLRSWGYIPKTPDEPLTKRLFDSLLEENVISDYGLHVLEDGSGKLVFYIWAQKVSRPCGYTCSDPSSIGSL